MKEEKRLIITVLWISGYLLLIDLGINVIIPYPKDPRNVSPSTISQFFEYGRSVEGKLSRMTRKTQEESAPILSTGWLRDPRVRYFSGVPDDTSKPTITVYGMSHSVQLAEAMGKLDSSFVVRSFGAPGAVPSWSYAAYLSDKKQHHSDVVVLAISTYGVPLICTTSGTTNHFDDVWPYTYPRFLLKNGTLESVSPPFDSLIGYREYFYDPVKWRAYKEWLNIHDKYYDPLLFRRTILDQSSIVRMLRRAYAYSSQRTKKAEVYDERNGFNVNSEEVKILLSIIKNFSDDAQRDNSLPIIYIVNNLFMGDHLYRLLEQTLAAEKILSLSSHEICPPDDPRIYLPDTHFIPSKNLELAKAMMKIVRDNMKAPIKQN